MEYVKAKLTAESVGDEVAHIVYRQSKAKFFNLLESQFEGSKLDACKKIAENMIAEIASTAKSYIMDILNGWEQEVEVGGDLTPEEEVEVTQEYNEFRNAVK